MIHLETERLRLRDWQSEDLEPFAAMNADKAVMEFFPAPLNRDESFALAKYFQQQLDTAGFGFYAAEIRSSGEFVGFVGMAQPEFTAPFTPAVQIGWRLARSAWGHGYASEAATACLDFGFTELGLEEIVSYTTEQNRRSIAVMERLGMTHDPRDDFEHPDLPAEHPLRRHVLYRLRNPRR